MAEDFPAWVRKEMRKKKIRQNDMAREFGQSQQYVSSRITGNIPFTYLELLVVFQVLETEPEDPFFEGSSVIPDISKNRLLRQ